MSTTTTLGKIASVTVTTAGTGYSPTNGTAYTNATMAGGFSGPYTITTTGGGGGGFTSGSGTYLTNTTTGIAWDNGLSQQAKITISEGGDIYQGHDTKRAKGVFQRLERLERMLGILHRKWDLEADYEPLRQIGDEYDAVCDDAIAKISEAVFGELKAIQDRYEEAMDQAKVYRALTRDD